MKSVEFQKHGARTYGIFGLDERVIDGNDVNLAMFDAESSVGASITRLELTHCGRPGSVSKLALFLGLLLTIRPIRPKPLMPTLVTIFNGVDVGLRNSGRVSEVNG